MFTFSYNSVPTKIYEYNILKYLIKILKMKVGIYGIGIRYNYNNTYKFMLLYTCHDVLYLLFKTVPKRPVSF